jgi:uncharacterized membrane protein
MAPDRTVLEHLQGGRDALVLEVERLTTAIQELDGVIARLGGPELTAPVTTPAAPAAEAAAPSPAARRAPAKKAAARRPAAPRTSARAGRSTQTDGGKSIRVHVLEMLGSEDRDFGLAEIIDRIHAQGIQAHDDAVRSITIKLMKDGRVERVGRGQYRLSGRARATESTPQPTEPTAPTSEPAPQPQDVTAGTDAGGYVPPLDFNADPSF